jgi:hypothetical protein
MNIAKSVVLFRKNKIVLYKTYNINNLLPNTEIPKNMPKYLIC